MEALMCLFGIAIGAGLVTGLWLVAKFAARNIDGEYDRVTECLTKTRK